MKHELYNFLCCPQCKGKLLHNSKKLVCRYCKKTYDIQHGVPILVDSSDFSPHLQKQIAFFEQEDKTRPTYMVEAWQERYLENFLKNHKFGKREIVIDNATGSGYMAIELAKKGYRVIATDLTLAELVSLQPEIKKHNLTSRVLLVCASSEKLPIVDNCASGMVANAILEHLPHEADAIDEISRVLKKDATLMLAMPINFSYVFPLLWPINILHDAKIGHLRRYNRSTILRKFRNFNELSTYYTGSLAKVFCLVVYKLTKNIAWLVKGEMLDSYFSRIPIWASNIVSILKKR